MTVVEKTRMLKGYIAKINRASSEYLARLDALEEGRFEIGLSYGRR